MDELINQNVALEHCKRDDDIVEIIDVKNIPSLLTFDERLDNEIDLFNMTSLSTFMLVNHATMKNNETNDYTEEDTKLNRLSLAYERLHTIPKLLLEELADNVRILDISHNEFEKLDFLKDFTNLTTLICDHNNITSTTNFPYLPKLELLWLNHCKIESLYPWSKHLQISCPNLRYLSLMGNPIAPSYLNGGNFYEYLQYRLFIISLFSKLKHLDDRPVTDDQRREAERMYHRPFAERLLMKTQMKLPQYLRTFSGAISDLLTPTPAFATPQTNSII